MKTAYTKSLIKDFPQLYRNCRECVQSSMQYGFAVGNGWYQILYELSAKIDERAKSLGISPSSELYPAADQVKEKFGGLRYYMHVPDSKNYQDLVQAAVLKASHTCEHCGQPGTMQTDGWYSVACGKCHSRKDEIFAERSAEWSAQERAGGYRKPINDAFAEVDAKAVKEPLTVSAESITEAELDQAIAESKTGLARCKCGISKEVCDRTLPGDPDLCRRVAVVMEVRRRDAEDEK